MGSMTQGVQAGIAAYQNSVRLKQLQQIADRQSLLQQAEMLKSVSGMPAGPVRQLAISKILGPLGFDPDTVKALSKANDEEFQSLGEMLNNLLVDHPELGRQGLQALVKSGKVGVPELWKMGQDSADQKRKATLRGAFAPESTGTEPAAIAQGPQPNAAPVDDFQLRTGPAGEALGMTPDAAPVPLAQREGMNIPPPVSRGPLTPQQQLERLDLAEEGLMNQLRKAAPLGGLTEDLARNVTAQREFIQKRRDALLKQIEPQKGELTEIEGPGGTKVKVRVDPRMGGGAPEIVGRVPSDPKSDVGKLQADRRDLIASGQGEGSPALKAIDAMITKHSQPDAQSPAGKLVDDYERAIKMYGKESPQAAAIKGAIDGERGVKPSDLHAMRGEFSRLSGSFIEVRDAFGRIKAVAKSPSQAGDLALLTGFMKMIDPTTGVREGELATASNAASIPERVKGLYNRLLTTNGRLSDTMRKDFVGQAAQLYGGHERSQKALEKQYQGLAKKRGFDPDEIVVDFLAGAVKTDDVTDAKGSVPPGSHDNAAGAFGDTMKRLRQEIESGPSPSRRR